MPAGNTRVLASDGSLITMFYRNNRTPVPSDRIAPVMKQALVAIEDARFELHNGLVSEADYDSIVRPEKMVRPG
jgi:membrane peptidoglycan carboxypeptidase